MNPAKSLLLFILIGFSPILFAQSASTINGTVSSNNTPLPFATVMLHNSNDSVFVKAAFTDSLGKFKLSTDRTGKHFITIKIIGYSDYSSPSFDLNGKAITLNNIELAPSSEALKGFEVTFTRPIIEVEPDKTVFNVDKTINATGSNGFDLLRKAPGVIIDNNDNIIVEGKSGVQVFINGKASILSGEDITSFLKSLQSSDVDAIEIITQPSSKYDAAGNAGIINIKLKKNKKLGTNGSLNVGYNTWINHRANSSLSLNHRNKKVNVYGNYSNNLGKRWYFIDINRTQEGFVYSSETDNTNSANSNNLKIGTDWFVNNNSTIGVLVTGNQFNTNSDGLSITEIKPVGSTTINQALEANNVSEGGNSQIAGNINYRYEDTLGRELNIDADYGMYNRDASSYQPNIYRDGSTNAVLFENNYRMITPTEILFRATKLDYTQKLWGGKIGVGAKYSDVETDNTFQFYNVGNEDVLNEDRSNDFKYKEALLAGYINYGRKLAKRLNMQLGLRLENTKSRGELISTQTTDDNIVEREYLNYFPSGGLTFSQNRKNTWALTFSRRIQRPNYQSLNPFESQISELSFRKGNPFLQPQYTTNIKLNHMFKYRFNTSLSYSYTQDFFAQIQDTLGSTKSFISPKNVANQRVINLGISLPFNINKWWGVFANINANNTSYEANDDKFQPINLNILNLYAQNTFTLNKKNKLELSGWFSTPSIWGGTYLTKPMGSLNIAYEHIFVQNIFSVRCSFNDILFTSPWRADLRYGDLIIDGTGGGESRRVAVNFIYNFGNQNVKRVRKRETSLEDEKKRTGN